MVKERFLASGARRWHRHLVRALKNRITYADYAALPDDGKPRELVAGELYVTPSASTRHQRVSKRLYGQLLRYFEGKHLGEVFYAPVDMILSPHDVFVPDIVVVLDPSQILPRAIEGPAGLVVEVLSRSNRRYDRSTKGRRYLALGVQHYWIVDPESRELECRHAEGGSWVVVARGKDADLVTDPSWPELQIDLADLWREPAKV